MSQAQTLRASCALARSLWVAAGASREQSTSLTPQLESQPLLPGQPRGQELWASAGEGWGGREESLAVSKELAERPAACCCGEGGGQGTE